MRKPTMSSQEDLKASIAFESDKRSGTGEQYKPVSRTDPNQRNMSDPKNRSSNGYVQSPVDVSNVSQNTTSSSSYSAQRQPIDDAVTSAFRKTESSMSPELIHLITQNVIQQLQVHNTQLPLAPPVQPPQPFPIAELTEPSSSFQGSPTIDRATVYTPPSPHRPAEDLSDSESRFTMPNHPDVNSHGHQTAQRALSPLSREGNEDAILSDSDTNSTRPRNMRRSSTDSDATVLERHWGKLFDEQGQGTERLRHFLRGIANHLIEEIEPRHSLVITPDKMQRFYEVTNLEERPEVYPWKLVFDDKTSSISRLLRDPDIQVHHHLVQTTPDARPDIPGLTPDGFATWLTLLIRAHPDHEYERLTKILRHMAINHPNERKQRFPAAIPRRLLPINADTSISTRLSQLMGTHCKIKVDSRHNSTAAAFGSVGEVPLSPRKADAPPVPPAPTVEDVPDEGDGSHYPVRAFESSNQTSPKSRKHAPVSDGSKAPSVTSIEDDEDDIPTPQANPFERERKPYVAQPGGGKNHDVSSDIENDVRDINYDQNDLRRTKSVSTSSRTGPPPPISVHQRGQTQSQYDLAELSHVRSAVEPGEGSGFRSRRYSGAPNQPHPFRRTRSNSTNVNEPGKRYHANQRSPSVTKSGIDFQNPRATVPEVSYGSGSYQSSASSAYPPPMSGANSQQPSNDRYAYSSRQQNYDPRVDPRYASNQRERSRGRDLDPTPRVSRQRHQSNAGTESRPHYDDSYRTGQQGYPNLPTQDYGSSAYQFPPSAYRDNKER